MPETRPLPEPTVATAVLLLVHVPPPASLSREVAPSHTFKLPDIGAGKGSTLTVFVVAQPFTSVKSILAVPADMPVTIPDADPTVAIAVLLLLQVPAGLASLKTMVDPAHTRLSPVMATGNGSTVNDMLVVHPADSE